MKRLFLICLACSTFIGCSKPFTEETVSDLAIKTLSAFEAEVKNPDNDLVAIVGELCEKAGMEIDKSIMVDDAENAVLYNILMEEGPTFEIVVEDYDQYTNVHIGFVYPKDVTQGNGIPMKLGNNLISALTLSGMEFYTGNYYEPKYVNRITSIEASYKVFTNGVVFSAYTVDKINANKPEDKFFLTAVNAFNCINRSYNSPADFEVSVKQVCENGGLSQYDDLSEIDGASNQLAYYTIIDNIRAIIMSSILEASDFFGEKYKSMSILLSPLDGNLRDTTLRTYCDRLKTYIDKHKLSVTYFEEQSSDNAIILYYMR